jgi:hypothetical protein
MSAKIITENGITLYHEGKVYTASKDHPNYRELLESIRIGAYEHFKSYLAANSRIAPCVQAHDCFTVENDLLFYNGRQVGDVIANRVIAMFDEGHDVSHMARFVDNLFQNPSNRAVEELYGFLKNENIPITDDGCFLAYKAVRSTYFSKMGNKNLILISGEYNEEGHINNSVGQIVRCERNCVDDDPNRACGKGLHVGGLRYAGPGGTWFEGHLGDRTVIVKVNPRDVVTIPNESCLKVRTCGYEVIAEYVAALPSTSTATPVNPPKDEVYCDWSSHDDSDVPYLNPESLEVGTNVTFQYKGEQRFAKVYSFNFTYVNMILLYKDPSFEATEVSHRNFILSEMSKVELY